MQSNRIVCNQIHFEDTGTDANADFTNTDQNSFCVMVS
jgi:hypothetical protein